MKPSPFGGWFFSSQISQIKLACTDIRLTGSMLQQKIKELAKKYSSGFIEVRHYLHAHPELSYQEFETSQFVRQKLSEYHIPFEIKATTGVVGLIKGKNPESRVIALRADMEIGRAHV